MAARAAFSAASCAANGVDLREPLKPTLPADAQEITFPSVSVIDTIVLLNELLMWTTPKVTFLRSFSGDDARRAWAWPFGYFLTRLLLVGHGLAGPLRVRALVGALSVDREALAVPDALVAADLDLALDVLGDVSSRSPSTCARFWSTH
jgi:hypothetical protein